jgi:hypothetical protein
MKLTTDDILQKDESELDDLIDDMVYGDNL